MPDFQLENSSVAYMSDTLNYCEYTSSLFGGGFSECLHSSLVNGFYTDSLHVTHDTADNLYSYHNSTCEQDDASPPVDSFRVFFVDNQSIEGGLGGTIIYNTDVLCTSGSLLNESIHYSSNYSLTSIKGAASIVHKPTDDDRKQSNKLIGGGLHKQWGLIWGQPMPAVTLSQSQDIAHTDMKQWAQLAYTEASKYGLPNYLGARVKVISQLNIPKWKILLKDYKFNRVVDYLEFGFPLSIDYSRFSYNEQVENHKSALMYPEAVDAYLRVEKQHNAIVGPYSINPFHKLHVSPMMTRPKPDGSRRLIVDLSWPHGASVNSCIPDNCFDNHNCILKYPTIDNIIDAIADTGQDALLFKIDLRRAYRNLRADPRDLQVLGLLWKGERYVDLSIPFGLKVGASACQMVTDSITHILMTSGVWTCAYLDDVIGVASPSKANSAFMSLKNLITTLGLPINEDKVSEPVQELTCLGIHINSKTGELTIPHQKIQEIKQLCKDWASRAYATRKSLQKLVGHLLYLHKCIRPARLFTNRILHLLRSTPHTGRVSLNASFYKDVNWFVKFMASFNGVTKIHKAEDQFTDVFVDACLTGIGAYSRGQVYYSIIPECYKVALSIVHIEMLNVMVAFRVWGFQWQDKKIRIHCDNAAVVHVLNSGCSRDPFLGACARTLWFIKAKHNIHVLVDYIRGSSNVYADTLSRWPYFCTNHSSVVNHLKTCTWHNVHFDQLQPDFSV